MNTPTPFAILATAASCLLAARLPAAPNEAAPIEVAPEDVRFADDVVIERAEGGGFDVALPSGQTFHFPHDKGPLGPRVAPGSDTRHHAIRSANGRYYAVNMMSATKACDPFLFVWTGEGNYRKIDFAGYLAAVQPQLVSRDGFAPSFVRINRLENDRALTATTDQRHTPPASTGYRVLLPEPAELDEPSPLTAEERVDAIRDEYGRLQQEDHRERTVKWQAEDGPHEGEATIYSRGDALRAVRVDLFEGGHSYREIRYYYADGVPFFLFEKAGHWSFDGKREGDTIDRVTERRLYLSESGRRVVRQLEKSYEGRSEEDLQRAADEAVNRDVTGRHRGRALTLLAQAHRWPAIGAGEQALRLHTGAGGDGENAERDTASAQAPEKMLRTAWRRLARGDGIDAFVWRPDGAESREASLPGALAKSHRIESVETIVASDAERRVRLQLRGREKADDAATGTLGLIRLDGAWRIVAGSWARG